MILKQVVSLIMMLMMLFTASSAAAMTIYSQTQSGSVGFPDSTPVVLTFTDALPAASDATLSLIAKPGGELYNNNKRLEQLKVEGDVYQTLGNPAGWMLPINFLDGGGELPPPITIPLTNLNSYVADGQVVISVVRPGFLSGAVFDVVLEYTSSVPEPTSFLLFVLGMAGITLKPRRRR